jgi:hypothetical protein
MRQCALRLVLIAVVATLTVSPLRASDDTPNHTQTWQFAGHGNLRVHFRAGDLKVVQGADSQHIVLRYTAEHHHQDAASRVKLRFESQGEDASVLVNAPNSVNFDAVLEVPGPLTLDVRMLAGDLTVERVPGSKSLRTRFGDIKVVEGKDGYPNLYRSIEASVGIGDLNGLEFSHEHGWLGHTGDFIGHGAYDLRAHVGAGDISFESQ